jgi:hypothetical protein
VDSDDNYSPSDDDVLHNLNSGAALSPTSHQSPSHDSTSSNEEDIDTELADDPSDGSDDTWTPSIDGEDSDEELDLDDKASVWQEIPIKTSDFSISFNKVDSDLGYGYTEEVKEIKKRVLREYYSLSSGDKKSASILNANEVMNALYNSEFLFSVLGFQNKALVERKKTPMDVKEYETFLRCFFGFCYYSCSLSDVSKHPFAYPIILDNLKKLQTKSTSVQDKINRMNDLLRSLEGQSPEASAQSNSGDQEGGVFWRPVFGIDRELEKLFRDVGGRTAHICFVDGYTNLIIDDEKLRMCSSKTNHSSLSRHKSPKSFGPVGNCINAISTGISLSCHMNHHGESSKEILTSGLMIIKGTNNPNKLSFPTTTIHGDRGYNDDECFELIERSDMGFLNTTKRGPSLAYKFGAVHLLQR